MRRMAMPFLVSSLLVDAPASSWAQVRDLGVEIRTFGAAYVPMGDFRIDFNRGATAGVGLGLQPARHWLFVLNGSWTSVTNNYQSMTKHETIVWQYDAGFEVVPSADLSGGAQFRPFLGFGGGMRRYDYKDASAPTRSCGEGYGAFGGDVLAIRFGVRGELRQYVSCFKSPTSGQTFARSNLSAALGLLIGL